MQLYFSKRRFFETSFYIPNADVDGEGTVSLRAAYRMSTTVRRKSIFPDVTTILRIEREGYTEKVVARIIWNWPSQESSMVEIDGMLIKLCEFLRRGEGMLSTDTHVMFGAERYTWKSAIGRPAQLYDPDGFSAARLHTKIHGLRPRSKALSTQACMLELTPQVSMDVAMCDRILVSFFAYRACKDLHVLLSGWWHAEQGDLSNVRVNVREEKRAKVGRKWKTLYVDGDNDGIEEVVPLIKAPYPFAMQGPGYVNSQT